MRRTLTYPVIILLLLGVLWSSGLCWFITLIPSEPTQNTDTTDAIVVLTGGSLRLDHGFELLAENRAKKMFISGVEDGVTLNGLLHSKEYRPFANSIPTGSVTLGYWARTTIGNAEETAQWVAREHIKTIRLVTGNYHIPRSTYELREAIPGIIIIPDPVFPTHFAHNEWWQFGGSVWLVISEYHKLMTSIIVHTLLANT